MLLFEYSFFFQAEDGIRDLYVTGVQTCALPIWLETGVVMLTTFDLNEYVYEALRIGASGFLLKDTPADRLLDAVRSEERRVGKECRSRGSPYHEKKKAEKARADEDHETDIVRQR